MMTQKEIHISKQTSNPQFEEVLGMIQSAKQRVYSVVNTTLIDLYWHIGEYISYQVETASWGKSIVEELATYIRRQEPNTDGFSKQNLWRMKQFYETYKDANPILSSLVRETTWTNNLTIMSRCKKEEEKVFYMNSNFQTKHFFNVKCKN